jgi:hypothetical protein
MSTSYLRGVTEWALMVALVFGAGAVAQAQNQQDQLSENDPDVVQIGRSDKADAQQNRPRAGAPNEARPEAPKYWIGLLAGDIPVESVLRYHLDLPENSGLLVANVLGNSPAAKAGLKQHDILLKANNQDLHEMHDLVDMVMTEGEKKGQITLEVLRHGKRESLTLKPEERPANAPVAQGGGVGGGNFGADPFGPANPEDLLQQFRDRMPLGGEFRDFGPGVIVGRGQGVANMPNGVSVSIQKQDNQPARVTVKRGDETWEVTEGDQDSLNKLPKDLRPFVEQMLHGGGPGRMQFNFREGGPGIGPEFGDGRLRERLERMEKRMEEMQKRFHSPNDAPADKPNIEGDQAK